MTGHLFTLTEICGMPAMNYLQTHVDTREEAEAIFLREVCRLDWCGRRQAIWMRPDGVIEILSKE
jgi:hypothetical protein